MKKRILPFLLLANISSAYANTNSAANFAVQAGSIAGAAQACGQDITEFTNRINQSLAILADSSAQIDEARQNYQIAMTTAAQNQSQNRKIPCNQVIQDYNSLPIMQPNYEGNVLGKLRVSANKPVSFLPPQTPPNAPNPDQNSFTQGGIPGASNTSAQGGIPNNPSVVATGGIPNTPFTPTDTTLIQPPAGTSQVPSTPSQFSAPPPSNTVTGAPADMAYAPTNNPPAQPIPSNSSVPAMPSFNPPQPQP